LFRLILSTQSCLVGARRHPLRWTRLTISQMHLLQTPSPSEHLPPLPVRRCIALDPWLEPLPLPSASTESSPNMPPMLVINSPGFTVWADHFERLRDMVQRMDGWLMTLIGSNRASSVPLEGNQLCHYG
jgi:hypothetical protein